MSDRASEQTTWAAAQLRDEILGGGVEESHPHAGLVPDDDPRALLNFMAAEYDPSQHEDLPGRVEETALYQTILANESTDALTEAVQAGNVSQMQFATGKISHERDAGDALAQIVRRLANEGTIAVVCGPPGSGKTALTLDAVRGWLAWTGGHSFGNTGWQGFDDVVHSDVELLEAMATVKGQTLGVIDEAAQSLTGRGADAKEAETFANRMLLIRKQEGSHGPCAKRGSLLAVAHNWDRMNAPTRRLATLVISKPSRADPSKVVLYSSPGGEDSREKIGEFSGLTDTRESYPEHEASHFDVVLEDDGEEQDVDEDDVRRQEAIATAIRATKPWDDESGMSYGDTATLVPYSKSWVGDVVREWENGQHRDIVDDPADGNE